MHHSVILLQESILEHTPPLVKQGLYPEQRSTYSGRTDEEVQMFRYTYLAVT